MFVVTWGQPARTDWFAALVVAHDDEDALRIARTAHPERHPPTAATPATPAVAAAVLAGEPPPGSTLPVLRDP